MTDDLLVSEVGVEELAGSKRLDAEFYRPDCLVLRRVLSTEPRLGDFARSIVHPPEVKREYEDAGVELLLAQSIADNVLDFGRTAFLSEAHRDRLRRARLQRGDLLVTRTGANFGAAAPYCGEPKDIYACADVLVVRLKGGLAAGYASAFLNSDSGSLLVRSGGYGAGQPHIAPPFLRTVPIPRFETEFEEAIDAQVQEAAQLFHSGHTVWRRVLEMLATALCLEPGDGQPAWTTSFDKVRDIARLDAEFFDPRVEKVRSRIKALSPRPLGDLLLRLDNGKTPPKDLYCDDGVPIIKVEGLTEDGIASPLDSFVPEEWARANTKGAIEQGDCAMLCAAHHPGYIGRTGIVVDALPTMARAVGEVIILRPKALIEPEVLCAYLNLPVIKEHVQVLVRGNTAHLYPSDLGTLPVPTFESRLVNEVMDRVRTAYDRRTEARRLLAAARARVDEALDRRIRERGE